MNLLDKFLSIKSIIFLLLFSSIYSIGQNNPPEILSFSGSPAGFVSLSSWEGYFTQNEGESAEIISSLGNIYNPDISTGMIEGFMSYTGIDTLELTVSNSLGSDSLLLVFEVFDDHNLLSDTLKGNDIEIKPMPVEITGDQIFYSLHLPLKSFINLYDFHFEPMYLGNDIIDITMEVDNDSLIIELLCNKNKSGKVNISSERADISFLILITENGNDWFQTGFISILFPDIDCGTSGDFNPHPPGYEMDIDFYCELHELTWKIYNTTIGVVLVDSFYTNTLYGNVDTVITTYAHWLQGTQYNQSFTLDITDPLNSCGPQFAFQMINTNGLFFNDGKQPFVLYPNPVKSILYLDFASNERRTVSIISINGNAIKTVVADRANFSIDLSEVPSGIYLVRVNEKDHVYSQKFIKH